ncbi:MAG: alpha/beta hydrolase-fold protein [Microgenomates group bacterium]
MNVRFNFLALVLICLSFFVGLIAEIPVVHAQSVSWNNPGWGVSSDVLHASFTSYSMSGSDNVQVGYTIYLPPGYNASQNKYPTVYFLHGINGHEWNYHNSLGSNANSIVQLVKSGAVEPMILVFPNGGAGLNYIDAPGDCSITKACPESMLIQELIPHIDQTYRTIPEKEFRAIQGFSMGGMGATYLGTKYPELFSSIAAQSSACQLVANCDSVKSQILANIQSNSAYIKDTVAVRLSYGSQEGSPGGTGIAGWQSSLNSTLIGYGVDSEILTLTPAGHSMDVQHSIVPPGNSQTFGLSTLLFHSNNFGNDTTVPSPSTLPTPSLQPSPTSTPRMSPKSSPVITPNPSTSPSVTPDTSAKPYPDYNGDNLITYSDFEILLSTLFTSNCAYNLLNTCEIDLFDYNAFMTVYESESL